MSLFNYNTPSYIIPNCINCLILFHKRLFPDSLISKNEACLLIRAFCMRFALSHVAKVALVQMIRLFLPKKHNLPKSYQKIIDLISQFSDQTEEMKYCPLCQEIIDDKCLHKKCDLYNIIQKKYDSFLAINITNQVIFPYM